MIVPRHARICSPLRVESDRPSHSPDAHSSPVPPLYPFQHNPSLRCISQPNSHPRYHLKRLTPDAPPPCPRTPLRVLLPRSLHPLLPSKSPARSLQPPSTHFRRPFHSPRRFNIDPLRRSIHAPPFLHLSQLPLQTPNRPPASHS